MDANFALSAIIIGVCALVMGLYAIHKSGNGKI
jgi:hypothetical protein